MTIDIYGKFREFISTTINDSSLSSGLKNALINRGNDQLVFFGAGLQVQFLLDFCGLIGQDVVCSVVSDAGKAKDVFFERKKIPVFPVAEFKAKFDGQNIRMIVAVNERYNTEISNTLRQNGIHDFCTIDNWKMENLEIERITETLYVFMLRNKLLTRVINGVVSLQAGSFKEYLLTTNMPEKIANLKMGLDADSLEVVDRALFKILQNPEDWYGRYWLLSIPEYENAFMTSRDRARMDKCRSNAMKHSDEFHSSFPRFREELLFHNGLFFADEYAKEYIKGKDFIDCGAHDGLSAIVFQKFYQPRKVYSFDISPKNCACYEEVMKLHNIPSWKYEMLNCGVSDAQDIRRIIDYGTNGMSLGRFSTENERDGIEISLTSIDDFVESKKGIDVGFITCDLEGHGLKALVGMEKTIKRFRPVLNLAMYHCPEEFFEMKPQLELFTRNMNYRISVIDSGVNCYEMIDISIFAYPLPT